MCESEADLRLLDGCDGGRYRWLEPCLLVLLAVVFLGVIWSVMEVRPMHHDEANQAYSARRLLDFHGYYFRPEDHHGPTLYFLVLPVSWVCGVFSGLDLSIRVVRLVPLLFSCGILLLPLCMGRRLGVGTGVLTGVLLCFSPCFCFYSNYFIQEPLLVFFVTLVLFSGWRWWESRRRRWAICFGLGVGLCIATKETWVLCAASAFVATLVLCLRHRDGFKSFCHSLPWADLGVAAGVCVVADLLLFSSFFTNPQGVVDFFRCWVHYANRGTSSDTPFAAPFHQYLSWLFWFQESGGPRWSEWLILMGFLLGVLELAFPRLRPRGLRFDVLLFFVVYAVVLVLLYSLISYKTPWCVQGMLYAMALVAGMGYSGLVCSPHRLVGLVAVCLLGLGCHRLLGACKMTMVRYCTDERNPFSLAHTQRDYLRMLKRLEAFRSQRGRLPHMLVCTNYIDAWPLPWYMQDSDDIHYVDFWEWGKDTETDEQVAGEMEQEPEVVLTNVDTWECLPGQELYAWEEVTLRPHVLIKFGVRKDCFRDTIPQQVQP